MLFCETTVTYVRLKNDFIEADRLVGIRRIVVRLTCLTILSFKNDVSIMIFRRVRNGLPIGRRTETAKSSSPRD